MPNSSKAKGDRGELEAAKILNDLLGVPAVRKLGAGRKEDTGDIYGVPYTTVQVVSRTTDVVNICIVEKPLPVEQQRARAGTTFAFTMVRIRGGHWRIVLTPEQYATYWREAVQPLPEDAA